MNYFKICINHIPFIHTAFILRRKHIQRVKGKETITLNEGKTEKAIWLTSRPKVLRQIPTNPLLTSVLIQIPPLTRGTYLPPQRPFTFFQYWISFYVKR